MVLSENTIKILRNFGMINNGICIPKGNVLKTISPLCNIFAIAEIPDEIPRDFCIYDLNEFLSVIDLFESPEIELKEDHLVITSKQRKVKYYYASPEIIVKPPEKEINQGEINAEFFITREDLSDIIKASSILKYKTVRITNDGLTVFDTSNNTVFHIDCEVSAKEQIEVVLDIENLKILQDDYDVKICGNKRLVKFISETYNVIYFIASKSQN